jgi:hypothetical protein
MLNVKKMLELEDGGDSDEDDFDEDDGDPYRQCNRAIVQQHKLRHGESSLTPADELLGIDRR